MTALKFLKMHGLGNDFVIFDGRTVDLGLNNVLIRQIADRHIGVGCDQVIVMESSRNADVFMRIYNPDGSEAGACGNATRCVASLIMAEKGRRDILVQTANGLLPCTKAGDLITVNMGEPKTEWREIPLSRFEDTANVQLGAEGFNNPVCVNMGNPHAVFFVEDVDAVPLERLGSQFEGDVLFPQRANIEFVQVIDRQNVRVRVWERGAGVTLACGSGACAVAVAAVRRGLTERIVTVGMGRGKLTIEWRQRDNCVYMTGAVSMVYEGQWLNA